MAKVELKQPIVDEIANSIKDAQAVVLVNYSGLTVEQDTILRKELREAGVQYKVYKNTMVTLAVKDTPFDFNEMKKIGQDIEADHIQLKNAFGYDHSFVLKGEERQLTLEEPVSGRRLVISTTAPVVQVYTGNFLKDGCIGKAGRVYENREGVALETQLMPNAIHTEENPSVILRKGEKFESTTNYIFETI